jgi:hypothetical protein
MMSVSFDSLGRISGGNYIPLERNILAPGSPDNFREEWSGVILKSHTFFWASAKSTTEDYTSHKFEFVYGQWNVDEPNAHIKCFGENPKQFCTTQIFFSEKEGYGIRVPVPGSYIETNFKPIELLILSEGDRKSLKRIKMRNISYHSTNEWIEIDDKRKALDNEAMEVMKALRDSGRQNYQELYDALEEIGFYDRREAIKNATNEIQERYAGRSALWLRGAPGKDFPFSFVGT